MLGACAARAVQGLREHQILEEVLRRIGELYAIEAVVNGQSAEQRHKVRQAESKPLLDALHAWMLQRRRRLSLDLLLNAVRASGVQVATAMALARLTRPGE